MKTLTITAPAEAPAPGQIARVAVGTYSLAAGTSADVSVVGQDVVTQVLSAFNGVPVPLPRLPPIAPAGVHTLHLLLMFTNITGPKARYVITVSQTDGVQVDQFNVTLPSNATIPKSLARNLYFGAV